MKHAVLVFSAVFAAIMISGCRVRDLDVVSISAPEVRNAACSNVVAAALLRLPGREHLAVQSIDYSTGTIVVRYDSMKVGTKNLEDAIAEAGFAAGPFPANQDAAKKLPPECRVVGN